MDPQPRAWIVDPRVASVPIQDHWIEEAGREARGLPQALVDRFMERCGLRPDDFGTVRAKIDEIKRCIRAPDHPLRLDCLAAYLDDLKVFGRQFVFLWRINDGQWDYLAELARDAGEKESGRLVWEADVPTLAEVRQDALGGQGTLRFKWVFTRRYSVQVPPAGPSALPGFEPRTQRAVTFFAVDLKSGDCELRIQSLPKGTGLPTQRRDFERYRAEVERHVDLSRFSPVLVEPVANAWLRAPIPGLAVTTWSAVRPSGAFLAGGGRGESIFSQLQLKVGDYFVRQVTLEWESQQQVVNRSLFFSLDGAADSVDFNGRSDAARVDFLLAKVRQGAQAAPRMRELRQLAAKYPEHLRIVSALDQFFAARKHLRVSAAEVAEDAWYDLDTIRRVFELAATEFPEAFRREDDVLVLRNRLRIREGGLAEMLERYAKAKGYIAAAAIVKPAMAAVTLLSAVLVDLLLRWLWSDAFERVTGVPFDAMEIGLVGFLVVLHGLVTFGGASARRFALRLLGLIRPAVRWMEALTVGQEHATVASACDAMFVEWSAQRPAA